MGCFGSKDALTSPKAKEVSAAGNPASSVFADGKEIFDVIIVGGGISGTYCAYNLLQKQPDLKIIILEKDDDIGGRLFSDDNDEDNDYNKDELGGMRVFPSVQKPVADLVKKMGCHLNPVRLADEQNLFFFEGERHRKGDYKLPSGKTPSEMEESCRAAYEKAMPEDAKKHPFDSVELRNLSLPAFFKKFGASEADIDAYFALSGYDTFNDPTVMSALFFYEGKLYGANLDHDQHYVQEGFEEVIHRMVDRSKGLEIRRNHEVVVVKKKNKDGLHTVKFYKTIPAGKDGNRQPRSEKAFVEQLHGKAVILAVPQKDIIEMLDSLPIKGGRKKVLQDSVTTIPLFKCFIEWPRVEGKEPWWREAKFLHGKSTTDMEIRQLHYYDREDLLVYCSGRYARHWDSVFRRDWKEGVKKMLAQIKTLHGVDELPEPDWDQVIWRFWPTGSHKFKTGVNVREALQKATVQQDRSAPDAEVYIVGDAYSEHQGWVYGALQTSDLALSQIQKEVK